MAPARKHPPSSASRPKNKIGIVSLAAFFRESLIRRVSLEEGLSAVDLGAGGPDSVDRARTADPDLVLVDLPVTQSCHLSEAIVQAVPGTRLIAVHHSEGIEELVALASAGFVGFVSSEASVARLLRELAAAMRGEPIVPPHFVGALVRSFRKGHVARVEEHLEVLSARERQVAHLLERRLTNKEIAAELGIESGTVKNHVHSVLSKLHLHNRWQMPTLDPTADATRLRLARISLPPKKTTGA